MTRSLSLAIAAIAACAALPAAAVPGGKIKTLPLGRYLCSTPGDATGPASVPVDGKWFDVVNASSYEAEGGGGTYLATGDEVIFTRGPMRGANFIRESERILRALDTRGEPTRLSCVRQGT